MSAELIEELRDTFEYHPAGYLVRKKNGKPCGQSANTSDGYADVRVNGESLRTHRIIYAIVHGRMPAGKIDHLNGDRMDNRIENLRDVSGSENMHNRKMSKNNTSGFQGVIWHAQRQKWQARINVDNQRIYLGYFSDRNDAIQARKMAKMKHHPSSPEAFEYALEMIGLTT